MKGFFFPVNWSGMGALVERGGCCESLGDVEK